MDLKVTEQIQEDILSLMDIPTLVDKVIVHILDYYEDEALMPVPASIIYNTRDPTTYDTLRFDLRTTKILDHCHHVINVSTAMSFITHSKK